LAQFGLDVAVHSPENLPLSTSPNRHRSSTTPPSN
jgi:hypothetical protein